MSLKTKWSAHRYFLLAVSVLCCVFLHGSLAGNNPSVDRQSNAYDSANVAKSSALEILRITPEGNDVPAGRQIVIRFNRPVVAIGRMERNANEIPNI
ncbi:MAG: hypothetical protein JXA04_07885 [Gammaproteobacteria bacterium]|nr:hypothetical protein [Gammaproteobacteria bacterium]